MTDNNKLSYNYTIKGAKKGQSKPRKPSISKDTASSTSTAKILYGLGEGEIAGLVDGGKSIFLDGTPLLDDSGNPNFDNVTWDFRPGTNDQEYMKGFPDVTREINVGAELRHETPFIRAINDTQLSAVRVRLEWRGLSKSNSENGDVTGYKIEYAIDLQTDGGAYKEIFKTKIEDKVSAGYKRTHRIDLPRATSGWQIRVRRITPNADSDLVRDTMIVDALAEVMDIKLSYPNTALLGLEFDAETFGGSAPKVAFLTRGVIVRVPTNYNPETRKYTGIWDGTFKDAYTTNPVWLYYDLCLSWRYGLGERLDATMIDKWSMYRIAQFCDEMVSNGRGGLEPRFTCDVYFQSKTAAYEGLKNLGGIFRAMSFWNGEKIVLDADMPQDPVYTFSRANAVSDNGADPFSYSGSAHRDRHTVAKIAWDNPANGYETEYEYVRDEKAIAKFGVRLLDMPAFGCTSQSQAQRAGLWALKTEQLETRQVSFRSGLDGINIQVGNIINISDELFAGRANGGRVADVSSSQYVITVDRDITASAGDTLIVNSSTGKTERRNIRSVSGRKITVTTPFDNAEVQHIWAIENPDLKLMRFRVMSITQNDDATYDITALQHEPKKYDAVDFGVDVKPTDITVVQDGLIDAPASVTISSTHRIEQGQTITTLVISWAQVEGAVAYDIEWRKDDGSWIKVPRTGGVSVDIGGVYSGKYLARVRAVNAFDVKSQPKTSMLTNIKGKVGNPPVIVGLNAKGVLFGFELTWGFGTGAGDSAYTEIQIADTPNVNVIALGQFGYPTNKHTIQGLQGGLKRSFRARLVDKLGNQSAWSAWVQGETGDSVSEMLDILNGKLTSSQLDIDLRTEIGKITTNANDIAAESTARAQAVLLLQEGIATETTQRKSADSSINSTLTTYISKTDANAAAITAEANARTTADSALSKRVDVVVARTDGNTTAITAEANARTTADTALSNRITTVTAESGTTKAGLASEITARTNADSALSKRVDAVSATAGDNAAAIKQESAARADAVSAVSRAVDTVQTIVQSQEIGGDNLIPDSEYKKGVYTWGSPIIYTGQSIGYATGYIRATSTIANDSFGIVPHSSNQKLKLLAGEEYTLSFFGQATFEWLNYIYVISKSKPNQRLDSVRMGPGMRNNKSVTFVADNDIDDGYILLAANNQPVGSWFGVGGIQLQKGNVATAWKPSGTELVASVQEVKESVDGAYAKWSMKLDVNGYVGGLIGGNNGQEIDFIMRTDAFTLAPPSGNSNNINAPFTFRTTAANINGTIFPVGAYLKAAFIDALSVDTGHIKNLAVDTLKIKDYAVTIPQYFENPNTITIPKERFNQWVTVASATFDGVGNSTSLSLAIEEIRAIQNTQDNPGNTKYLEVAIFRGNTILKSWQLNRSGRPSTDWQEWDYYFLSFPRVLDTLTTTSSTTYSVRVRGTNFVYNSGDYATGAFTIKALTLTSIGMRK